MPTFNKNKSLKGLLATIFSAGAVFLCLSAGVGFAQVVTDNTQVGVQGSAQAGAETGVQVSPFKFHDLEANHDRNAAFGGRITNPDAADAVDSVKRLEYAAEGGSPVAMWQLGRIYSSAPEGQKNHLRAFEMFSNLVTSQGDFTPYSRTAPFTANALVALGSYYRTGIPDTYVQKNAEQAWSMFLTAATYYGDPKAQFALFEMCDAEAKDVCSDIQAGRWLKRSADNGHISGQALFGIRLFDGEMGFRRNKVEGLKWLSIARERADRIELEWVHAMHEQAFALATVHEREEATARAEIWMRDHCKTITAC